MATDEGNHRPPGERASPDWPSLHRIAVAQVDCDELGRAYYRKRLNRGKPKTEALRALERLARIVFQTLKDNPTTATASRLAAAA